MGTSLVRVVSVEFGGVSREGKGRFFSVSEILVGTHIRSSQSPEFILPTRLEKLHFLGIGLCLVAITIVRSAILL